jgi:hypothetical protein
MKLLNKIIKDFQDINYKMGSHNWIIKPETFNAHFTDRNKTIQINRYYRICSNCFKCQHSGIGIHGNKWFNEDEEETNNRKISRRLKLNKIKNGI